MNLRLMHKPGLPWISIALLVAAVLPAGCGHKASESRAETEAPPVLVSSKDVARVETRRLEAGVTFTGELVPIEIVEVTARYDGDLDKVLVREGQAVRRGQPLAVYRPRDVEDRLRAAEAQLAAARAGLRGAENAERRVQRLHEAGAASASDLEVAESMRTAAQAALDQAAAMHNTALEDAEKLDVPSPIAGWVSRVMVHGGDRTSAGDRLVTVVQTDTLELSATIPSDALDRVRPGTPIRLQVEGFPGETFRGEVGRINPTTEPGTRQVRIYMRLPNRDGRLLGGLFASGRVIDEIREDALAAPVAAVRSEGAERVVYRLSGGRAERIPIRIGLLDEAAGVTELLGAVGAGDSLLTGVLPGLRDGVRVRIVDGGPAQEPAADEPAAGN